MTGLEITEIRDRLGISTADLAKILCVNPSTAYRWEGSPSPAMDPIYRQLVLQLYGLSVHRLALTYGRALKDGLKIGPTFALHVLLAISFNDWNAPNAT